jgi:malate permease and related proteins
MINSLFEAYTPLILWTGLGLFLFRFLPKWFPQFLGRALYWIGVPLELLALARQNSSVKYENVINSSFLAPIITIGTLIVALVVTISFLWGWKRFPLFDLSRASEGSFLLAAVLGNTGFVGLAIAPFLVDADGLNFAVIFSITHNVVGPYGLGVLISSYFSHTKSPNRWWVQLRDILTVPPLWAFIIGSLTTGFKLPNIIESGLQQSIGIVIACAFLLTGIRLAQVKGWKSLKLAIAPAIIRVFVIPLLVGILISLLFDLSSSQRLAMVLMSGMPSAFAGLILAEEYNLDRDLIASSIFLSTLLLLLVLPLWIVIFG